MFTRVYLICMCGISHELYTKEYICFHGPLTRYDKLRVAHAPGIPGTFSLPPTSKDLLPDTKNCGLCMRQEYRERFPCHPLKRKPLVSYPGMHHGTYMTAIFLSDSGHVPSIPGACVARTFTYLARGPSLCSKAPVTSGFIIPSATKFRGGILDSPCSSVRLSVYLSVCPSVCPSVRPSVRGSVSGW